MTSKPKRKLSGIGPGCTSKPGRRIQKGPRGTWLVLRPSGTVEEEFPTEQEAERYLRPAEKTSKEY